MGDHDYKSSWHSNVHLCSSCVIVLGKFTTCYWILCEGHLLIYFLTIKRHWIKVWGLWIICVYMLYKHTLVLFLSSEYHIATDDAVHSFDLSPMVKKKKNGCIWLQLWTSHCIPHGFSLSNVLKDWLKNLFPF